jgi:hypothetical protein
MENETAFLLVGLPSERRAVTEHRFHADVHHVRPWRSGGDGPTGVAEAWNSKTRSIQNARETTVTFRLLLANSPMAKRYTGRRDFERPAVNWYLPAAQAASARYAAST